MMAFGLDMLGVAPTWNSRGIVTGLTRLPPNDSRVRRDVTFVASGLFRDLYGHLIDWLDRAVLVALEGARESILAKYPDLNQRSKPPWRPWARVEEKATPCGTSPWKITWRPTGLKPL